MKELMTKKFWQDVRKTFEEAQQDVEPKKQEEEASTIESPPEATNAGGSETVSEP